jgi:hypothetical protein
VYVGRDEWGILDDVVGVKYCKKTTPQARDDFVIVYFENGSTIRFMMASECSGFTMMHVKWAEISPHLFTYFLVENKVLNIMCPYSETGYFTDISYFER